VPADWAAAVRAATEPVALVTVLATEGSAPRGPGARMAVTAHATVGTIGGGALEWQATDQARAILAQPRGSWRVQDYPLGPLLGQCCGGRVRLLVEHLAETEWIDAIDGGVMTTLGSRAARRISADDATPISARGVWPTRFAEPRDEPRRPLLIFGAGHVGRAIARIVPGLPFDLAWYDSRAGMAATPGVTVDAADALVACAGTARADAAVVVLTHDHALDYRLVAAALGSPARFVGVIGSATKRGRFLRKLADDGIDAARLTCPIGLPDIVGKDPAVIAVAVAAQLLSC
jgi:xanthine dehydrogenase accessory factor